MTETTLGIERELFETWDQAQYMIDPEHYVRENEGCYKDRSIQCRWECWQYARASAAITEAAPIRAEQLKLTEAQREALTVSRPVSIGAAPPALQQAAQQALEALELSVQEGSFPQGSGIIHDIRAAIAVLRAAMALDAGAAPTTGELE